MANTKYIRGLSGRGFRVLERGNQAATISNATPAVVTAVAHGFSATDKVVFKTTAALPASLVAGTVYFVIAPGLTADAFRVSLTSGGAAINTTTAGSGTHSVSGEMRTCKEGVNVQANLDDVRTQDILSRERDNFVRVSSTATTAVIKPLHRRGFRLTPRSSTVTITEATPGVVTFTAHGLKTGDAVTFSTTGVLPDNLVANTVYYVSSTTPTVNTFRVSDTLALAIAGTNISTAGGAMSGTHTCTPVSKNVGPDSDVTVNLNDGATKRFLKRNFGRYIVLNAAGDQVQNIVGLRDAQNSFRVEDPTLTLDSAAADSDLTFTPKTSDGEIVTIALTDPGTNETAISAAVEDDTDIVVELDITQNVQADLTIEPGVDANDAITYTATAAYPGTGGHAITVAHLDDVGNNIPLSVDVTGTAIEVTLETDGTSTPVSTATEVAAAVNAHLVASTLVDAIFEGTGAGLADAAVAAPLAGGVDYTINSTADEVKTEIEATPGAHALVAVTLESVGAGVVDLHAATALGDDPEGLSRGEVVTAVNLTDSFNVGQLRRHFKAWVENLP